MEYTAELTAFDLLGVKLVHGWLLDPRDIETSHVVSSKSYNDLIMMDIVGSEAREAMKVIEGRLVGLEERYSRGGCSSSAEDGSPAAIPDWEEGGNIIDSAYPKQSPPHLLSSEGDEIDPSQKTIVDAREEMHELSLRIVRSEVANAFHTLSGHQLTHHGLMRLHEHVGDDALCIFFRNNHFVMLTRHDGGLYLLVTDLGYANTPEIVWEKLDNIDGDTATKVSRSLHPYWNCDRPRGQQSRRNCSSPRGVKGNPIISSRWPWPEAPLMPEGWTMRRAG